jgi:hypothetical protein
MNATLRHDEVERVAPQPPHNIEAEQGLLGAILNNNDALKRVNVLVLNLPARASPARQTCVSR